MHYTTKHLVKIPTVIQFL